MGEWEGCDFMFASRIGPTTDWFAWYPVKTWCGRTRFLCWVQRQRFVTHDYLPPPQAEFWAYQDPILLPLPKDGR